MEIKNLNVSFGERTIFKNFNLNVNNTVTAIMGASGVGKTTLLKAISGIIECNGEVLTEKIGYVFQEPRLVPSLTVLQNVALVAGEEKAKNILEKVELSAYANFYPKELSGGMAQRVNLARAFCTSNTILLDEPFKELDYSLKLRLIETFKELLKPDTTAILITHDVEEAISLADRIIVLGKEPAEIVLDVTSKENNVKSKILSCLNNYHFICEVCKHRMHKQQR